MGVRALLCMLMLVLVCVHAEEELVARAGADQLTMNLTPNQGAGPTPSPTGNGQGAPSPSPTPNAPSSSAPQAKSTPAPQGKPSQAPPSPSNSAPPSSTYEGDGPPPGVDYPSVSVEAPKKAEPVDVNAVPKNLPQPNGNISSNVTSPTLNANNVVRWGNTPLPPIMSNMFRGSNESVANLPKFYFNLANSSLPLQSKQLVCDLQVQFCQKAGCAQEEDEIEHNFCDVKKGMATMCKCKKGASRLMLYQWPVQASDCQIRRQTCKDVCNNKRETNFRTRSECIKACDDQIGSSCDKPEQYGVSYMVDAPGQTPKYDIIDQSVAQGAASHVRASATLVVACALAAGVWLSAA